MYPGAFWPFNAFGLATYGNAGPYSWKLSLLALKFNYCTLFIHFVSSALEYMKENKDSVACQVKIYFALSD